MRLERHRFIHVQLHIGKCVFVLQFTFKDGAYFPNRSCPLPVILAQSKFHIEQWHPRYDQEKNVGDQKGTWRKKEGITCYILSIFLLIHLWCDLHLANGNKCFNTRGPYGNKCAINQITKEKSWRGAWHSRKKTTLQHGNIRAGRLTAIFPLRLSGTSTSEEMSAL